MYQAWMRPGTKPRMHSARFMNESALQMPRFIQTGGSECASAGVLCMVAGVTGESAGPGVLYLLQGER